MQHICTPGFLLFFEVPALSFEWKTDTTAGSVDLGKIYERKVKRSDMRKWLAAHEKAIHQKELKHLSSTADLFIISHVLYSEKIVIHRSSSSGEKALTAGPISLSSKYQTQSSPADDIVNIRPDDVGIKPIAFKVAKLKISACWYKRDLQLVLAPQTPTSLGPRSYDAAKWSEARDGVVMILILILVFLIL